MRVLLAADRIVLRQFADVGPGDEGFLPSPREDHDADGFVVFDVVKRRPQLFHRGHVERIEHLRPVHGDISDGVFLFENDVFEVHVIRLTTEAQRHEGFFLCLSLCLCVSVVKLPFNH
jgi:hypothetical protein